ncbi:MAG TPA: HupE/UreJ family protein [Beijerinckiaceae bacterium]|jgi:urease accessory protein
MRVPVRNVPALPCAALALALAAVLAASGAQAHHAMGGETPRTLWQGLVSGLAHPVIGLDHLAFTVAAGLLAAPLAAPPGKLVVAALMPLAFLASGAAGAALHVAGHGLPFAEIFVALSVLALGALLLSRIRAPAPALAALFAAAGLFHGHALAESIVGAEPAPLAAYFMGLVTVQYAIALGAMLAARRVMAERPTLARGAFTAAGAAVATVGFVFLLAPAA